MNNSTTIIREFNNKIDLYRDYAKAVNNLLENLLKGGKYKYQLSHRIKSLESLKEKIKRKKNSGKVYKHIGDIEDIVGMRIVFYTKTDRKKYIKDLTKALGKTLKIEETSKVSGYRSTHAIITFGQNRTHLDEYKRFKGLKCEIQMTLILNHAWAEVEHDMFYKEGSEIQGLDKKSYSALKERMQMVMCNYIQKASVGLENIIKNVRKLESEK